MARFLLERTVVGRIGLPSDIAEAVADLIDSGRSGYVTGESLLVDRGALARLATE